MASVTLNDYELAELEHERLLAPLRDANERLRVLLRAVIDDCACDVHSVTGDWLERAKAEVGDG